MAATEPTYYNIGDFKGIGMSQGDIHKAIYNLYKAVYAICYNLDDDAATLGIDYLSAIGTDLETAMTNLKTPSGNTT